MPTATALRPSVPRQRAGSGRRRGRRCGAAALWLSLAPLLAMPLASPAQSQGVPALASASALQGGDAPPPPELRLSLGARTELIYGPRPWQPEIPAPSHWGTPAPQAQLGLQFRTGRSDALPRGLFRVQLSGASAVHFRPRGGGLTVSYRSQF